MTKMFPPVLDICPPLNYKNAQEAACNQMIITCDHADPGSGRDYNTKNILRKTEVCCGTQFR